MKDNNTLLQEMINIVIKRNQSYDNIKGIIEIVITKEQSFRLNNNFKSDDIEDYNWFMDKVAMYLVNNK
jgi:hypothetical protein